MAIEIPRALVEHVLLGPLDDRRQLQDSPILGDVWIAFARRPAEQQDLLMTPYRTRTANQVATEIDRLIDRASPDDDPNIAFLQGIVAARLYFHEILRIVMPVTGWWHSARSQKEIKAYFAPEKGQERLNRTIEAILGIAKTWGSSPPPAERQRLSAFDRYVGLAGLVLWAGTRSAGKPAARSAEAEFREVVGSVDARTIAGLLADLFGSIQRQEPETLVFQVSLNRTASSAIVRSVPAVKGDAARTLFSVNCEEIAWAVIDSGIDRTHPAFLAKDGKTCRVRKSFDFTQFRRIVSLSNAKPDIRKANLRKLRENRGKLPKDADKDLQELAEDARKGRQISWSLVEKLVTIDDDEPPLSDHGTHVAGIIGASKETQVAAGHSRDECADGMCPDIGLYDFRVLAPNVQDTEFAIIAALQYIRHLNERNQYITIHGANLSLSIPHDVRNYACGRTPICLECERLVESGVVVVAAAGNFGYHSFETSKGSYEGYAALSITDPGNADGVITVGSTHRYSPHTFGVSFFSSRGPTGDGRPKPDLVAPGERICGPLPGALLGDLDGTSMAAPHVSGAAAMLMARYTELIGQPRRIKRILCDSATDLGRERSFQGHGMLDVLRAFQSV